MKGEFVPTGCWNFVSLEELLKADVENREGSEAGTGPDKKD
jgi:hypothetical protein